MEKFLKLETIEKALESSDWSVRAAAFAACKGRDDVPLDLLKQGLVDSDPDIRAAAFAACQGRHDISLDRIKSWMVDDSWSVRQAAIAACQGRHDVPLGLLKQGLVDSDPDVRQAAFEACQGRDDISLDLIKSWMVDDSWSVRAAALELYKENGIPVPVIRTFEPPERVYKKCLCDVIVVAEIPKDAQVRGALGKKCRASRAVIKEIIGDFCGEKVGISSYDMKTCYYEGDEVEVEDFDYSNAECFAGFHFFCTLEEAKNFNL